MKYLYLLLISIVFSFTSNAQDLNKKLDVDPNVKIGKLKNGLTYYIRHNEKPDNKVELRLVVNAGSVLETDAQQGIAHLSEHMAFNGTKNFKKNDIVSYLQSIGVGFGNDLNAYTSFDETVYILPIPTDNPSNIDKGFQILQDWAENVTYNDKDIDEERPVVLEESRLGKGANDRMMRQIYPELFAGSQYGKRLPIGIDSIIKNASYADVKSFYKEWYRPNLMAVIVVGDIDPKKAEDLVKKYFSGLKNPPNEKVRTNFPIPPYSADAAKVVTDKEATSYMFLVNYSADKIAPEKTLADYKSNLVKNIFTTLLNQRLRELAQKPNPPFVFASASFGSYARGYEAFNAYISTGSNPDINGLKAFEEVLANVKKYGFLQSELDRVKTEQLNYMEKTYNERTKTNSANYVGEYIRNFLEQEPIPGIEKEYAYYKELLPKITLQDVNAVSKKLENSKHEFIALAGPEPAAGVTLPTADQLLAVKKQVAKMELEPYKEDEVAKTLLKGAPKSGSITGTTKDDKLKTVTYTLSNNVLVTIRQTDFKNDEILMSGIRKGGRSNFEKTNKYDAQYMVPVIMSMGVGDFNPTDLKKVLSGKTVYVAPTFADVSEGISGSSSVKDLESMLQLTYLYFTAPRKDTALFNSFIQKNKSQVAFLSANPQIVFIDSLTSTLYHHSPLAPVSVPKAEYFDAINLDKVMAIYDSVYSNANGMHFYLVGNVSPDSVKPLLEKYLGSLPSSAKEFTYTDNNLRPVKGEHEVDVYKGKDPKALIIRFYNGEVPYSDEMALKAEAVSKILNIRIIEELREKIGGIYGGGTQLQMEKYPYPHYTYILQLPCGPEKVDTLIGAFDELVQDMIKNGPSQDNLDKVKKQWLEEHKVQVKQNNVWLSQLRDFDFLGERPDYFLDYEKYVNGLSVKDVQEAAKQLLSTDDVVTGILRPEKQ